MSLPFLLVLSSFRREKLRPLLAVFGIAAAVGLLVWSLGLAVTSMNQSHSRACAMTAPFDCWFSTAGIGAPRGRRGMPPPGGGDSSQGLSPRLLEAVQASPDVASSLAFRVVPVKIDARPGGRILQGPPLSAGLALSTPSGFPFTGGTGTQKPKLTGRWPDPAAARPEAAVCTAAFNPRRLPPPALGSSLTLISSAGPVTVTVVGTVDFAETANGFPTIFASASAFESLPVPRTPNLLLCSLRDGVSPRALAKLLPPPQKESPAGAVARPPRLEGERPSRPEGGRGGFRRGGPGGGRAAPAFHTVDEIASSLSTDKLDNFKRQAPLLLTLCILTALCMLSNALTIGVDRKLRDYALLRCAGMTARQIAGIVALEGGILALAGWACGLFGGWIALFVFVHTLPGTFPEGVAMGWVTPLATLGFTMMVAALSLHFPCRAALRIRPLDTVRDTTKSRVPLLPAFLRFTERLLAPPLATIFGISPSLLRGRMTHRLTAAIGMVLTLAAGLATYSAIHIWGASMMEPFIPSPEFPDAIVSILPNGVKGDVAQRVSALDGVRDHNCLALESLQVPYGDGNGQKGPGKMMNNVLMLGVDPAAAFGGKRPLAPFRFVEGSAAAAIPPLVAGKSCLITKMFSRCTGLHAGDTLNLSTNVPVAFPVPSFRIVGVVDLNWHLVTSRAQLRGRNGFSQGTMGPIFVSESTARAFSHNEDTTFFLWLNLSGPYAALGALQGSIKLEDEIRNLLQGEGHAKKTESGANVIGVHHRDEIADGTIAHGSQLIGDMARAPFWSLIVLCTGIITLLVTSYEANAREFATMRAVGMTRSQLSRVLLGEAAMVGLAGIFLSLLLGVVFGFAFTFLTRASMAFSGLPVTFCIPWLKIVEGVVFAFALCVVMAAIPVAWLVRHEKRFHFA